MATTQKIQVSQDALYEYLSSHDVKLSRIAELMGRSLPVVSSCFLHHKNNHGNARCFSVENIELLNKALPQIAAELRGCLMTFGSPEAYTNRMGRTYDPALLEPIRRIGQYINIRALTLRLLGWNLSKTRNILVVRKGKIYGNISEANMVAINTELLSVAAVLDSYEVIPDEGAYDSSSSE